MLHNFTSLQCIINPTHHFCLFDNEGTILLPEPVPCLIFIQDQEHHENSFAESSIVAVELIQAEIRCSEFTSQQEIWSNSLWYFVSLKVQN